MADTGCPGTAKVNSDAICYITSFWLKATFVWAYIYMWGERPGPLTEHEWEAGAFPLPVVCVCLPVGLCVYMHMACVCLCCCPYMSIHAWVPASLAHWPRANKASLQNLFSFPASGDPPPFLTPGHGCHMESLLFGSRTHVRWKLGSYANRNDWSRVYETPVDLSVRLTDRVTFSSRESRISWRNICLNAVRSSQSRAACRPSPGSWWASEQLLTLKSHLLALPRVPSIPANISQSSNQECSFCLGRNFIVFSWCLAWTKWLYSSEQSFLGSSFRPFSLLLSLPPFFLLSLSPCFFPLLLLLLLPSLFFLCLFFSRFLLALDS